MTNAPRGPKNTVYRIARDADERAEAFHLVYESYLQAGLGRRNSHELRVTPYHLLSTTEVFVAVQNGRVISTFSLIRDAELGVPMESMYPDLVLQRRNGGIVGAEASCLARPMCDSRTFMPIFIGMARLMAQFARFNGIDQLLAVVHPRHARFYTGFLGFEKAGGVASCPHVQGNPAIPLCLDFERADRVRPRFYDAIFGDPMPPDQLQPHELEYGEEEALRQAIDPEFDNCAPLGFEDYAPTSSALSIA